MEPTQVWSCGGGVQSAAIAALIVQGRLPQPDIAVIVDTEREKETTWAYYDAVLQPELAKVGVDLIRVPKSLYTKVDVWRDQMLLIPAFSVRNGIGKLSAFCSVEWKKRVVMRFIRDKVKSCQNWLGISLDEMNRVRAGDRKWFQPRYPLIFDVPMRRAACVELVRQMGWPPAPRSSCYMCPHHDDREWLSLTDADFRRAVDFEREMQKHDEGLFLHRKAIPLDRVGFEMNHEDSGCQMGFCFT